MAKKASKTVRPDDTQQAINALVAKYGTNFLNHPDHKEWLAEVKVTPEQITPERLKVADATVRGITLEALEKMASEPPPKPIREDLITWLPPIKESFEDGLATFHIWKTECDRYRIGRVTDTEDARFVAMAKNSNGAEVIVKNNLQSLRSALNAIEKYHNFKYTRDSTKSNRDKIVESAEEDGLYDLTDEPLVEKPDMSILDTPPPEKPKKEKTAQVGRDIFGSKFGTIPAKINAALRDEFRPFENIVDDSGLPRARVKAHLFWLLGLGKVEQTGNRWRIKQNDETK